MNIDIDKLKELYIYQKYSANKCAEYFSVSNPTFRKILKENNIEIRGVCKKIECPDIEKFKLLCSDKKLTNNDIAKEFNVNVSMVVRWIERNNIDRTWKYDIPSKEDLEKDYILNNMSFVDIGKKYGVSNVTAKKWILKYNIEKRKHSNCIKNVSDKIKETHYKKYGKNAFNHPKKSKEIDINLLKILSNDKNNTNEYIANNLKISLSTLNRYFKNLKISRSKEKEIPSKEELYNLYEKELKTLSEIANIYNVNIHTVCSWLRKTNIKNIDISKYKEVSKNNVLKSDLLFFYDDLKLSTYDIAELYKVSSTTVNKWFKFNQIKIRNCNERSKISVNKSSNIKQERYGYSNFKEIFYTESKDEKEVRDFLNSLGFNFIKDRTILSGEELDCYDEKLKMAVEYNGIYWHSEARKKDDGKPCIDKKYHYNKYKRCLDQGITLISVFEDEWLQRKEQVKDFLKSKLGIFEHRIFARKCYIKEVSKHDSNQFFDDNHIQKGHRHVSISFGLYYNDILVACMGFGKNQRENNNNVELLRMSFLKGYQIIGGASKLFKYSSKNINKKIITFSDNRWTNGQLYEKLGFKNIKKDVIYYSYFNSKTGERVSQRSRTKGNIHYPPHMTELEYNEQCGYYRIFDCGKKKWLWEPKNEK